MCWPLQVNLMGGDALSMIVYNVTPASLHSASFCIRRSSVSQLDTHMQLLLIKTPISTLAGRRCPLYY